MLELARLSVLNYITSPQVQQIPRFCKWIVTLCFWEHFHEDVCSHDFSGAVFDVDVPVSYGLVDEMILYVDVLGACMVIVIHCKVKSHLIVTEQSGWLGPKSGEMSQ
jgi:uncharacterized membrane protein